MRITKQALLKNVVTQKIKNIYCYSKILLLATLIPKSDEAPNYSPLTLENHYIGDTKSLIIGEKGEQNYQTHPPSVWRLAIEFPSNLYPEKIKP